MLSPPAAVLCCEAMLAVCGAVSPVACTQPARLHVGLRLGLQSITVAAQRLRTISRFHLDPSCDAIRSKSLVAITVAVCQYTTRSSSTVTTSSTIDQWPSNSLRSEFFVSHGRRTMLRRYQKFQPKPTNIELKDAWMIFSNNIVRNNRK